MLEYFVIRDVGYLEGYLRHVVYVGVDTQIYAYAFDDWPLVFLLNVLEDIPLLRFWKLLEIGVCLLLPQLSLTLYVVFVLLQYICRRPQARS